MRYFLSKAVFPGVLGLAVVLAIGARADEPAPPALANATFLSPAEVRAHDSRTLGQLVAHRLRKQCDEVHGEAGKGFSDKAVVLMLLPHQHVASVIQNGFLNQHVTNVTGGYHGPFYRYGAEQGIAHLRLPYGQKAKSVLPKYALFNIKAPGYGSFDLPTWYGEVLFVFKLAVLERTTWTANDSLRFSYRIDDGFYPAKSAYYQNPKDSFKCMIYCESQVWGELDLSDVAYAMIDEETPEETFQKTFALLKATGIAVFRSRKQEMPNQVVRVKRLGAPISSVDPKLLKGPLATPPRAELEAALAKLPAEASVPRNILEGRLQSLKTSDELAQQVLATKARSRNRINALAELAARGDAKTFATLKQVRTEAEWKDDGNGCEQTWAGEEGLESDEPFNAWMGRLQLLIGLSDFPSPETDQAIRDGLLDSCRDVWMTAASLAQARKAASPEIALALQIFYENEKADPLQKDWYNALQRPNVCVPTSPEKK